jgi:Rrf2 family protein
MSKSECFALACTSTCDVRPAAEPTAAGQGTRLRPKPYRPKPFGIMGRMRISARADYAVRAALQLAASRDDGPLKAEAIADAQDIPHKFLESILNDMRRGGLVLSQRGGNGGYRLARPAESISIADVIRVVDGPLVSVRGVRPPELSYTGPAESLLPLWIALRSNVREILDGVSLADVASAELPVEVSALTDAPDAWMNP